MIDFNMKLNGANKLVTQNTLNLIWQTKALKTGKRYQLGNSTIAYFLC